MQEENNIGIEQLKSVYKAHTEAYLDFNMALINIISNQKEIISQVETLKSISDEEFRNLAKEYAVLEKLFEKEYFLISKLAKLYNLVFSYQS